MPDPSDPRLTFHPTAIDGVIEVEQALLGIASPQIVVPST